MPGFSSSVPLLCMELEVALVLSVGIPPVPGKSCSMRFPAPDIGETTVPVIECEVPLLVVDALKPVEGSVHRQLPEHAEPLPASPVRVRSGRDPDFALPREADVLAGLLVSVPHHRHSGPSRASPADLHLELSLHVSLAEAAGLDEDLVPIDCEEAVVLALAAEGEALI